jgi:nucleotide-binding universal stress UspA family protein
VFNKILVPLDGSKLAERALGPALALGAGSGREVLLLRVVQAGPPPPNAAPRLVSPEAQAGDLVLEQSWREAQLYLNSVQATPARPDVAMSTRLIAGAAERAIVDAAREERADIIVMSTHGYSGLTRLLYGSVTEKVLGEAPCPVMVVRSPEPLRKILIPLDGTEFAQQALAPGLEIAAQTGAEVLLVQAVPRGPVDEQEIRQLENVEHGLGELMRGGYHRVAESYMEEVLGALRPAEVNVEAEVTNGRAAQRIIAYAKCCGIDLIVMATHGRTGLQRWMYGSITEKVLRSGCCSMLIMRPTAHELN